MAEPSSEPIPSPEAPPAAKGGMGKIVAIVVAIVLILVAIGAWLLLSQPSTPPTNSPPSIQSVSADRSAADMNQGVAFTVTASDPDGDALTYKWDFGDGTNATIASPSHAYAIAGRFIATVTVDDGHGHQVTSAVATSQLLYLLVNHPLTRSPANATDQPNPVSVLWADKSLIQANDSVTLSGNSSWTYSYGGGAWALYNASTNRSNVYPAMTNLSITNLAWTFGDGTTATGNYTVAGGLVHKYTSEGVKPVRLTATNYLGKTDTVGYTILVSATPPPSTGIKNPDIFTEATFGEPESLDPAYDYETSGGTVIQNVAEGLIWYNGPAADQFKAVLATKVPDITNRSDVSPDGKIWNFTLKPNIRFHYGTDTVNCGAVKFSFTRELVLNDGASPAWIYDQSLTAYAVDNVSTPQNERTDAINASIACPQGSSGLAVQFNLAFAYPAFLSTLAFTGAFIIDPNPAAYHATSQCYYDANGNGRLDTSPAPGEQPDLTRSYCHDQLVGTGPFKLRVWQPNQQIILDRFDNYWRTVSSFKEVHIVKANDVATRVLMLKSGDADYIALPVNHRNDIRDAQGNLVSGVTEKSGDTFNVAFLGFNQNINVTGAPSGDVDVPANFFSDINVRKAFAYAWKYTDFIQNVLFGYGTKLCGPVPRGMFGYNATTPCYTYDLTKTQQFLQLALDTRTGNPTDTYWDNGFTITIYYNIGNTVREEGARMLQATFNDLNALRPGLPPFTIKVQPLEWASFLQTVNRKIPALFFLGWAPDYADPDDYAPVFLHTGYYFPRRVAYSNTTLDGLLDQQTAELNVTTRFQLLSNIALAAYYDVPYIWMDQGQAYQVMRTWVQGFYENPMTFAGTGNYYYDLRKA